MKRHALALVRCAALAVLAVAGFAYGLVFLAAVSLVVPFPAAMAGMHRLTARGRRLARTWGGADLPDLIRLPPPKPLPRPDGWYVHDNTLYRSPRVPAWMLRAEHYGEDPEIGREWRWLLLAPVTSSFPALVPPALLIAAAALLPSYPGVSLAAAALAFLLAPAGLRLHGMWTTVMLRTGDWSRWTRSAPVRALGRANSAVWRGAGLAGISLAALAGTALNMVVLVLTWFGLFPHVLRLTRPIVGAYRRVAGIPSPYRPYPAPPRIGDDGFYRVGRTLYASRTDAISVQKYGWVGRDPATWRDQVWSVGAALLAPLSFLPALLMAVGFYGLVWQPLTWVIWAVPVGLATGHWVTPFYLWYAISPDTSGWISMAAGLGMTVVALALALPLLWLRNRWDRALLGPTSASVLATRVAELSTSRADAVDVQAAELRRIERDLHDGAQARLIAVGLGLDAVSRLMETDPVRARRLLTQAQESSATALGELRDLVRGIHPPVLAERGLADAVRAVALDTPLPVTVDADLPARPEPPVESAVYFAACEALANAARVASRVSIELSHRDGVLRLVVTDDGPGGADEANGTGLRGVRRRLGTFDGTLSLHSPAGGPTVLTMEVPCALSSPKTSTS
ncbi:histidine kinase [Actinoplanes sp. NPDC051861]|uniref:sensor histidine kinase n=1 Tax=Actinoplanes sp. NPDC051861 TaxID=3155170 RepID=UPI0034185BF5